MCKCSGLVGLFVGLALLLSQTPAQALYTALTPLQKIMQQSTFIVTAKVESVDADKPAMVLVVQEDLKGNMPVRKLAVLLKGDAEAKKKNHVSQILKRIAPKLPLVLFLLRKDKDYTALAYTNGTWFQMIGVESDGEVKWRFTHGEPYLRKTFKGSTSELKQTVVDGLAGKKDPPKPDAKEKPGFGPEVPIEKKSTTAMPRGGALFAVIPTVLVGGPSAVLVILFPAVFGSSMLVLRRWLAALSVLSVNSTLYLLQQVCRRRLADSWWGTPAALWLTMMVVTLFGILWAWSRHLAATAPESDGGQKKMVPRRLEIIVLSILSALCLGTAAFSLFRAPAQMDLWCKTLLMFSAGCWMATLHALYRRRIVARTGTIKPGMPGEAVLLWTMLLTGIVLVPIPISDTRTSSVDESVSTSGKWRYRVAWRFQPKVEHCWIASSPMIDDERVYIGVVLPSAFGSSGAVYCVERATGKEIWMFNDGGNMKDVFSSPCLADRRVYIGEGFHQHADCKLYCLDAQTGKKLWDFATTSHVESTPCVAEGKVYFGAGDDGLYCLDAATGKKRWHLEGLHVDVNPLVIDNRLYGGSGVGDSYRETVLFCLNADNGDVNWRIPVDLPVWGMPAVQGEYLYAGIGNGNFQASADQLENAEKPAGAMLCLERATGKHVWRYDVPDGIHVRPCVDDQHVWFAGRDRHCYCLDRLDRSLCWKTDLGSPILASPALVGCGENAGLYIASSEGRVSHLDPKTGKIEWTFDVGKDAGQPATLFATPRVKEYAGRQGESRSIWFGCGLSEFTRGILYCLEENAVENVDP